MPDPRCRADLKTALAEALPCAGHCDGEKHGEIELCPARYRPAVERLVRAREEAVRNEERRTMKRDF